MPVSEWVYILASPIALCQTEGENDTRRLRGRLFFGPGQSRNGLTAPASAVLCSQTPYHHARHFLFGGIFFNCRRLFSTCGRQLYAHSTAGKRRIGLRQMYTITSAKVLRHHIYGS